MAWFNIYHGLKYPYGNGMQYDYTAEFDSLETAEIVAELEAIADYDENDQTMKVEDYYAEYRNDALCELDLAWVMSDAEAAYEDSIYMSIESKAVPTGEDKEIGVHDRSYRLELDLDSKKKG